MREGKRERKGDETDTETENKETKRRDGVDPSKGVRQQPENNQRNTCNAESNNSRHCSCGKVVVELNLDPIPTTKQL